MSKYQKKTNKHILNYSLKTNFLVAHGKQFFVLKSSSKRSKPLQLSISRAAFKNQKFKYISSNNVTKFGVLSKCFPGRS